MMSRHRGFDQKNYYFIQDKKENIKDLESSISFGLTFIFSFFLAGLTGYYFGTYFCGFELASVSFFNNSVADGVFGFHYRDSRGRNLALHYQAG